MDTNNNTYHNPVISPQELQAGDRVVLLDGYADIIEVVGSDEDGTHVKLTEDGDHLVTEAYLPNEFLLEVERKEK